MKNKMYYYYYYYYYLSTSGVNSQGPGGGGGGGDRTINLQPSVNTLVYIKCNYKDSLENFTNSLWQHFTANTSSHSQRSSRRTGSNLRLTPLPAGRWRATEPPCSPDIRLTAPLLLDTHSWQHSAKDTRKGHFSKTPRRFRHLAKAQTLRSDMLTCNNRVTPQHWAAILNETKLAAWGAIDSLRHCAGLEERR